LVKKSLLLITQQLILGTGTAIWWLTEPHWDKSAASFCHQAAAQVPDMFRNFSVVKIHKIAKNSATVKREKNKH
jgi:hypothetical protein